MVCSMVEHWGSCVADNLENWKAESLVDEKVGMLALRMVGHLVHHLVGHFVSQLWAGQRVDSTAGDWAATMVGR